MVQSYSIYRKKREYEKLFKIDLNNLKIEVI